MSTVNNVLMLVLVLAAMSVIVFINHEIQNAHPQHHTPDWVFQKPELKEKIKESFNLSQKAFAKSPPPTKTPLTPMVKTTAQQVVSTTKPVEPSVSQIKTKEAHRDNKDDDAVLFKGSEIEKKGSLVCDGKLTDSEVIFWKKVKGDRHYESPITPHHDSHHDKYLTFEYDHGGWNNIRMGLECIVVVAHATGRTLVVPPQQHLYLLGKTHQDKHDKEKHDEMGFEDFFDIDLLKSHQGYHMISMKEFLMKEAATGGLHPEKYTLPKNNTEIWGRDLWFYLSKVADATPAWSGKFMMFPDHPSKFNSSRDELESLSEKTKKRLTAFAGERKHVVYNYELQQAHHIHIRGDDHYRVLQHHYAFAFFESPEMQSFYKRFVRDFVRYKDPIQCAGHELVAAVRADSRKIFPDQDGTYYALHIRRGDFQYKNVKISAAEILRNLNITDSTTGKLIIPPNSVVYISTDDPDGKCKDCYVNRKACDTYAAGTKPVGCPEDTSWNAFTQHGWKIRFLRDYLKQGLIKDANPNTYGMIESIVCSRAKVFAGTYFSTFTGYIHRMRGYHGLGEATYYHHQDNIHSARMKKSVGHGWPREWRAGWTDDGGELI